DHLLLSIGPYRRVAASIRRHIGGAGRRPSVVGGVIPSAGGKNPTTESICTSTPDDHFTAGPHCRVPGSGRGCVGGAGGCPTVGVGVVSSAGVERVTVVVEPAPHDHFVAGPHGRVSASRRGRVGGTRANPTVGNGVISAAGAGAASCAPDDHFSASPH